MQSDFFIKLKKHCGVSLPLNIFNDAVANNLNLQRGSIERLITRFKGVVGFFTVSNVFESILVKNSLTGIVQMCPQIKGYL